MLGACLALVSWDFFTCGTWLHPRTITWLAWHLVAFLPAGMIVWLVVPYMSALGCTLPFHLVDTWHLVALLVSGSCLINCLWTRCLSVYLFSMDINLVGSLEVVLGCLVVNKLSGLLWIFRNIAACVRTFDSATCLALICTFHDGVLLLVHNALRWTCKVSFLPIYFMKVIKHLNFYISKDCCLRARGNQPAMSFATLV